MTEKIGFEPSNEWVHTDKRILVTGTGLVGRGLIKAALGKDQIVGFSRGVTRSSLPQDEGFRHLYGDILNERVFREALVCSNPDVVVHTVALTDVDYCQKNRDEAFDLNTRLAARVAVICSSMGIPVLYISTDYVFPRRGGPFGLKSKPGFLYDSTESENNVYGESKWYGEPPFLKGKKSAVLRVCSPYDASNPDKSGVPPFFMKKIINNEPLTLVSDARTTYTDVRDISLAVNKIVKDELWGEQKLFHVAGPDQLSACQVVEIIKRRFPNSTSRITTVSSDEYFSFRAPRPIEAGLNDSVVKCRSVEEGLFGAF